MMGHWQEKITGMIGNNGDVVLDDGSNRTLRPYFDVAPKDTNLPSAETLARDYWIVVVTPERLQSRDSAAVNPELTQIAW